MPTEPHHTELEPFGQGSARVYLRAALLIACALAAAVSTLMLVRSEAYYDSMTRIAGGRRVVVASGINRLIFFVGEPRADDVDSSDWVPHSISTDGVIDAWQPSWKKTLGVEFGTEPDPSAGADGATAWRLRVRWRTLIVLYTLPLVMHVLRRRAGRRRVTVQAQPTVA